MQSGFASSRRWQPFIDTTNDSHSHEPLENDEDRWPFLLLNPATAPPEPSGLLMRTIMGVGL